MDDVTALLCWRQRRDSHTHTREVVREDVAVDTRRTVDLLAKAVVAQGEEIMRLKHALLALASATTNETETTEVRHDQH